MPKTATARTARPERTKQTLGNATIEDGHLVLRLPLITPTPSESGKSLHVVEKVMFAETPAEVDGRKVIVNVNGFVML